MTSLDPTLLIERVRRVIPAVIPALNFRPDTLPLSADMVRRMRGRQEGKLALNSVANLLVYVGSRQSRDAGDEANSAAASALEGMSVAVRALCERIVVVWDDLDGEPQAAAFSVGGDGQVGNLLAASWLRPEDWPDPMIDVSVAPDAGFEAALADVKRAVGAGPSQPTFMGDLKRSMHFLDLALAMAHGEGQPGGGLPDSSGTATEWTSWLERYEASVRDEWERVNGRLAETRVRAAPARSRGPLYDTRVFVSYARPDSTALARPVVEALRAEGADVWFDQEEALAVGWLDEGLQATIRRCDAYLLCASNEFFERAGYATQELAWAVEQVGSDAALKDIVVVALPGTVLPRIARDWPVLELPVGSHGRVLGSMLTDAIRRAGTRRIGPPVPRERLASPTARPVSEVDADSLMLRVRHKDRLHDVPIAEVHEIAASRERDARTRRLSALLRDINRNLDWDGHLVGHETWPSDPLIRAYRWMLGCERALCGLPWPLSGDLNDADEIAHDVEVLATELPPVDAWPNAAGWSDAERRLLLRFHLSVLRVVQDALHRGVFGGMLDVDVPTIDSWEGQLWERRQECVDALVAMRLKGTLTWRGDPPIWEGLCGIWLDTLVHRNLFDAVPLDVWRAARGNLYTFAGLAAQVTWLAIHLGEPAAQSFVAGTSKSPIEFRSWVGRDADTAGQGARQRISVGLVRDGTEWMVRLFCWGADDVVTVPAAFELIQAMNFPRA